MKNRKVKFKPLTPIHIGNGEEILPYEYVIKNGYLYKLSHVMIYSKLNEQDKKVYEQKVEKGIIELRTWIREIFNEDLSYERKVEVTESLERAYNEKLHGANKANEESAFIVEDFVNSFEKFYIPGSSIKGAFRNAYEYYLGKDKGIFDYRIQKKPKGEISALKEEAAKGTIYGKELLGYSKVNEDPFRAFKVSDLNLNTNDLKVYESRIYTYKKRVGELEKGIPVYTVCTKGIYNQSSNLEWNFYISLNDELLEKANKHIITIENLMKALNVKSKDIIEEELSFYSKSNYEKSKEIYEKLYELHEEIDPKTQAIIRIGKGSGFNTTTFNLANKNRSDKTDSRSRVLIEDKYPMGWALIEITE